MYRLIVNYIMRTDKIYYHVIEEGHSNDIASHGYYDNQKDADAEANRLGNFFQELTFYVLATNSTNEPEICTI